MIRNQNFESNGPDVKVRGSAQQVVERYLALARDASSAGDRIAAESYYQHAEHYYRVLTANGGYFNHRDPSQFDGAPDDDEAPRSPPRHPGEEEQPHITRHPGAEEPPRAREPRRDPGSVEQPESGGDDGAESVSA